MAKIVLLNTSNVSADRKTKLDGYIDLQRSFWRMQNLGVGVPPFFGNLQLNFKIWTRISQPPRVLWNRFGTALRAIHRRAYLSKQMKMGPSLNIWRIFLYFFRLENFQKPISQNFHSFFRWFFCAVSTAIVLTCELKHIGASWWILAPLGPPKWSTILANYEINSIIKSGRGL